MQDVMQAAGNEDKALSDLADAEDRWTELASFCKEEAPGMLTDVPELQRVGLANSGAQAGKSIRYNREFMVNFLEVTQKYGETANQVAEKFYDFVAVALGCSPQEVREAMPLPKTTQLKQYYRASGVATLTCTAERVAKSTFFGMEADGSKICR